MSPAQPDDLKRLGERIEEAARRHAPPPNNEPPNALGIAWRFGLEMVSALAVGAGLGWCLDWAFGHWSPWHTRPWGMVVLFVLGAVAGIRNVMAAAKELNDAMASKEK